MTITSTAERNQQIVAARQRGETLAAIATTYGITRERVRQICIRSAKREVVHAPPAAPAPFTGDILGQPVSVLGLRQPFANNLTRSQVATVGILVQLTPKDVLSPPNAGKVCLSAIESALASYGLALQSDAPALALDGHGSLLYALYDRMRVSAEPLQSADVP